MTESDTKNAGRERIDLRADDIQLLNEMEAGGFARLWADELHKNKSGDRNQERWHLGRMGYLAGRLIERGYSHRKTVEILAEHRELRTDKSQDGFTEQTISGNQDQ